MIAMAYIAMASGSPWVVPFLGKKDLSIDEKFDIFSIGVDECLGECGA